MTQKGRVVYDRKKNVMRPRDIARILDSYSEGLTGREFGEFVQGVLAIALDRQPRKLGWKLGFWLMLVHLAGIPEDASIRDMSEEKMQEFFMGGEPYPQKQEKVVETIETQAERKRRLARR